MLLCVKYLSYVYINHYYSALGMPCGKVWQICESEWRFIVRFQAKFQKLIDFAAMVEIKKNGQGLRIFLLLKVYIPFLYFAIWC